MTRRLTSKAADRPDGNVNDELDEVLALAARGGGAGVRGRDTEDGSAGLARAGNLDDREREGAGGGVDLTTLAGAGARDARRAVRALVAGCTAGGAVAVVVGHDAFGGAQGRGARRRVLEVGRLGEDRGRDHVGWRDK